MNKLPIILFALAVTASIQTDKISTTAGVCLTGGVLKSSQLVVVEKYKRKDCPVCKGKGWYISGDGIAKVDCGYCEPEDTEQPQEEPECKTEVIRE